MKVVITGAAGFLGWHVRCAMVAEGHSVDAFNRESLWTESFKDAVESADAVVHCAGVNRGTDEEVREGNISLATRLADTLRTTGSQATTVYLNSTHIDRGTVYGDAKREAADILKSASSGRFVNLVVPNVFGEFGRPFFNSVVSTFCHQLATGTELSINDDASLELVHAQDVADEVLRCIKENVEDNNRMRGTLTSVATIAEQLSDMFALYRENILPSSSLPFERSLFNTLRSYDIPGMNLHELEPRRDNRGHLVEMVKSGSGGQLFVSWTNPGITRGNHFHRRKIERFVVLEGQARIRLRRLFSDNVTSIEVNGDSPVSVDIPTLHTHEITNVGDGLLLTAFWTDEIFDPNRPETYAEVV